MILDMQGGFRTEERGGIEIKVTLCIIKRARLWSFNSTDENAMNVNFNIFCRGRV